MVGGGLLSAILSEKSVEELTDLRRQLLKRIAKAREALAQAERELRLVEQAMVARGGRAADTAAAASHDDAANDRERRSDGRFQGIPRSRVLAVATAVPPPITPMRVVEAFAEACRRRGVAIEHSTVGRLVERPDGWTLERQGADAVAAHAVVVAAGYDAPSLLATIGVDLPIEKEARYLLMSDPIAERLLEPLVVSAERHFAAKHLRNGRVLASDLAADGDPEEGAPAWRAHVKESVRRFLPVLEYVTYPIVVEGFYDATPDHQPLIAEVESGLWVAAGFSGHGFMIAPAVGRIVAEALLAGRHDPALESFALDRFAGGSLAPELQIV